METIPTQQLTNFYLESTGTTINKLRIIADRENPQDSSYNTLTGLLAQGYDIVTWVASDARVDANGNKVAPCPRCTEIQSIFDSASFSNAGMPDGFLPLAGFLGMRQVPVENPDGTPKLDEKGNPVYNYTQAVPYKGSPPAPMFNWAHPGCECYVMVSKRSDPGDVVLVQGFSRKD